MPRTVTVALDDEQLEHLESLARDNALQATTVEQVLDELVRAAAEGMRRPGAWERGWVEQLFGPMD